MPAVKVENVEVGKILVDPDGHLYEIVGMSHGDNVVFLWLWPDGSSTPNMFQQFEVGEEINFVAGGQSE